MTLRDTQKNILLRNMTLKLYICYHSKKLNLNHTIKIEII